MTIAIFVNNPAKILNIRNCEPLNSFLTKVRSMYSLDHQINLHLKIPSMDITILIANDNELEATFTLPSPIYLHWSPEYPEEDVSETSIQNEPNVEIYDLNVTISAANLSAYQNQANPGKGSRWERLERNYLKNFHKYLLKRNKEEDTPTYVELNDWLKKRKTVQSDLFGRRTTTAILAQYIKMKRAGEFSNL